VQFEDVCPLIQRAAAVRLAAAVATGTATPHDCEDKPTPEPIQEHHLIGLDGIPAIDFRVDFQAACASLGKADRRLATLLSAFSPTEASRAMGISRSTVYEGIRRIRVAFENAGYGLGTGRGR
jgi:hypothetical protein